MTTPAMNRRVPVWLATLGLLAAAHAGGCVTQDYIRDAGQSAAKGAMQGVTDSLPTLKDPLRQTLRSVIVDDPMLKEAAGDMTRSAVRVLETQLGSPEMRQQVDALVAQAMESLGRGSDEKVRALVKTAGGQLETELRKIAMESVTAATTTLRDSIERDVSPATQRLAQHMGDQLVVSLVAGLEGPMMQEQLVKAGRNMSQALIKGAAQGADDPINQASFGGLTHQLML